MLSLTADILGSTLDCEWNGISKLSGYRINKIKSFLVFKKTTLLSMFCLWTKFAKDQASQNKLSWFQFVLFYKTLSKFHFTNHFFIIFRHVVRCILLHLGLRIVKNLDKFIFDDRKQIFFPLNYFNLSQIIVWNNRK